MPAWAGARQPLQHAVRLHDNVTSGRPTQNDSALAGMPVTPRCQHLCNGREPQGSNNCQKGRRQGARAGQPGGRQGIRAGMQAKAPRPRAHTCTYDRRQAGTNSLTQACPRRYLLQTLTAQITGSAGISSRSPSSSSQASRAKSATGRRRRRLRPTTPAVSAAAARPGTAKR